MIKVLIQNPIDFKFPNVNLCVPTNFWQYFTLGSLQGLGEWNNCKLSASFFIESLLHMDWFILLNFQNRLCSEKNKREPRALKWWNPGCQAYAFFKKKQKKRISSRPRAKSGARDHRALPEHSPDYFYPTGNTLLYSKMYLFTKSCLVKQKLPH